MENVDDDEDQKMLNCEAYDLSSVELGLWPRMEADGDEKEDSGEAAVLSTYPRLGLYWW